MRFRADKNVQCEYYVLPPYTNSLTLQLYFDNFESHSYEKTEEFFLCSPFRATEVIYMTQCENSKVSQ